MGLKPIRSLPVLVIMQAWAHSVITAPDYFSLPAGAGGGDDGIFLGRHRSPSSLSRMSGRRRIARHRAATRQEPTRSVAHRRGRDAAVTAKSWLLPAAVNGLSVVPPHRADGTWAPRDLVPGRTYLARIELTRTAGTLTPYLTGQATGSNVAGTPITTSGFIEQKLTASAAHTKLTLQKDAAFVGEIRSVSLRWIQIRTNTSGQPTGHKRALTLAGAGGTTWYKRTPEIITLERCGLGSLPSDDIANMPTVQRALTDAKNWAKRRVLIKLWAEDLLRRRSPGGGFRCWRISYRLRRQLHAGGCGRQSVLKNCNADYFAAIDIQGGNNITLRNFTIDANNVAFKFSHEDGTVPGLPERWGGNGLLFPARTTPIERLVIETSRAPHCRLRCRLPERRTWASFSINAVPGGHWRGRH
jgi:hypothetical protein